MTLPLESLALLERIDAAAAARDSNKLVHHLTAAIAENHQELFDALMQRPPVEDTAFVLGHLDVEKTKGGWMVTIKGQF